MPLFLPRPARFWHIGLSLCLLAGSFTTLSATTTDSLTVRQLLTTLEQFQASPAARLGTVALSVKRIRDGQCLIDYNAGQSLSPASTLKLITTATALAVLGPSFTYTTTLEYDGTLRDSILNGNLYVRGSGDPSLGSWRFADYADTPTLLTTWANAVAGAGIRQIQGAVIGDGSLYTGQPIPDTWPWGDIGNYYGAGLGALNMNENLYRVVFKPAKTIGSPAPVVRTEPSLPYLTLSNRVITDAPGTGDQVVIYAAPFTTQVDLSGKVPSGRAEFVVKGALPDPAYTTAFALSERLQQDSIPVSTPPTPYRLRLLPVTAGKRVKLLEHKSPPLTELVQQTNFQSLNLYAEALLRTTALALNPSADTFDKSVKAVETFWRGRGIHLDGFRPKDGSGLSTVGSITADNMTSILTGMAKEKTFAQFYESIPVVGESGTVRKLARTTLAAGNVRAKSGSIEGVRAYAGYFTASDGELMCFSVLVNKYTPGQTPSVVAQLARILALLPTL